MRAFCNTTAAAFNISDAEQAYCVARRIPLPRHAPFERLRHMLTFVNYIHLYRANCAKTGKPMLSWIAPESGFTVYDMQEWEKDDWDGLAFGRDIDFSRPFFEQFAELLRAAPLYNLSNTLSLMENSEYTNCIGSAKNCYLLFEGNEAEDVLFSICVLHSRSIIDSAFIIDSELCIGCWNLRNCYNVKWSRSCTGCSDSAFLQNCRECRSCYGCVNLSRAEFCFFNEQLTKEEYAKRMHAIDTGSFAQVRSEQARFEAFAARFPVRAFDGRNHPGSTGNFISGSRACRDSFFVTDSEDLEHCIEVFSSKNCIGYASYGNSSELLYDCVHCGDFAYDLRFCFECWMNVTNLEYCGFCAHGVTDCFGCVSLKRRSHCILNKQYSPSEYQSLVARLKDHMLATGEYGEFFPKALAPHPYNKSTADMYLPLEKNQALQRGFRWKDDEQEDVTSPNILPDHIADLGDDAAAWTLKCVETGKPYKLTKPEIRFYRSHNVPAPRIAPMERVHRLSRLFAVRELSQAVCCRCSADIQTAKAGLELLCEECAAKELHG